MPHLILEDMLTTHNKTLNGFVYTSEDEAKVQLLPRRQVVQMERHYQMVDASGEERAMS